MSGFRNCVTSKDFVCKQLKKKTVKADAHTHHVAMLQLSFLLIAVEMYYGINGCSEISGG